MNAIYQWVDRFKKYNRVYILPTKEGITYLVLHFILIIIGIGYQNNIAIILFALLTSFTVLIMIEAHFHLEKIHFLSFNIQDSFINSPHLLELHLVDAVSDNQFDIKIKNHKSFISINKNPAFPQVYGTQMTLYKRGKYSLNEFVLSSTYPFGFFRVWTHLPCKINFWVFPEPLFEDLRSQNHPFEEENTNQRLGEGDYESLKEWERSDKLTRIAWKKLAQHEIWATKNFATEESTIILLEYQEHYREKELSLLVGTILKLDQNNLNWRLKNVTFIPDQNYKESCLRWLSEVPT